MDVRGTVIDDVTTKTVSTSYGESELAEVPLRIDSVVENEPEESVEEDLAPNSPPEPGVSTTATLWGKWTESAALLEAGMSVLITNASVDEYDGRIQYGTTAESYVVVEPGFLVNVTTIRNWVQCPRLYYLNKLSGIPLNYPVVKGTIVHEVFGDLLRGRDLAEAIEDRVTERGLELGLLGESVDDVIADVEQHAGAIEGWLEQGRLTEDDSWRSEQLLISETFGIRGRADAIRRGTPVELKTGKNLGRDPRFEDKVQATCYALLLEERGADVDTGTLLYTKNSALDRTEESGDLSPAKDFSIGPGFQKYVVRMRNEIAAMEASRSVPTGYEGDAKCEYCFEQDTCMVVSGRLDQESKAGQIGRALPDEELAYFEAAYDAIEAERRAVHREYAKLWEQSAKERAEDDRALVNLEFLGVSELERGRYELRASRRDGETSKLREGDLVLASDGHPVRGNAELARIERLDDEIVLTADEPVAVTRLDVYPSEFSTDRLLEALHDTLLKGDDRRKDVLFGRKRPTFDTIDESFVGNNAAQNEAVCLAVGARDCAMIHGPPGTGKTYTIARTIRALIERGERVLLSAFTNRAVDNALAAVLEQLEESDDLGPIEQPGSAASQGESNGTTRPRVVRIGSESGVREDMLPLRLERSGDPQTRASALEMADVVAATTASCGSRLMKSQSFDVALVDEAAQLTEPGTFAAISLADRFVLVGDHEQLPPVLQSRRSDTKAADPLSHDSGSAKQTNRSLESDDSSTDPKMVATDDKTVEDTTGQHYSTSYEGSEDEESDGNTGAVAVGNIAVPDTDDDAPENREFDLSVSLFERLVDIYPEASVMLDRQYRMNQRIQAFASNEFYDNALRPATAEVAGRTLEDLPGFSRRTLPDFLTDPVTFVDVEGTSERYTDSEEAAVIATILDHYVSAGLDLSAIGVIAPFRAQVAEISRHVPDQVTVDTVDRFQGSSKEVIVVSFTATGVLEGPIFEDYRRINVALTRPKRALVLVGDTRALSADPVYERMLEWAR